MFGKFHRQAWSIRLSFAGLVVFVSLALVACAGRMALIPPDLSNPVYTVAVLPFYNASNDVEGPRMMREEFFNRIQNRHYSVMSLEQTDSILVNQMGITLGSQLELTTPEQLGEILGVDGVIYGYVLNFDDITTGLYNVKKVRAGFKLVDARTGAVVWSRGLVVKVALAGGDVGAGITLLQEIRGDGLDDFNSIKGLEEINGLSEWHLIAAAETKKAGDAAIIALSEKLLTTALGVHLKAETNVMLNRVMRGFPAGPGSAPAAGIEKTSNKGGAK